MVVLLKPYKRNFQENSYINLRKCKTNRHMKDLYLEKNLPVGCSQQKMKRSFLHSVELLVYFLLIQALVQVRPLSQSQISVLQISKVLTLFQISC